MESSLRLMDQIESLYKDKIEALEKSYENFYTQEIQLNLTVKPFILILGQDQTGKSSFIRYLIGQNSDLDPPPLDLPSNNFTGFVYAHQNQIIPGKDHVTNPTNEFSSLAQFGSEFIEKFNISCVDSKVLKNISIMETPTIINSNNSQNQQVPNLIEIIKYLAERADRIILIFDPFSLTISPDFVPILRALQSHERRFRIILNKVDILEQNELRRVQGILTWSLGRIMVTPESPLVHLAAFNSEEFNCESHLKFVNQDMANLLNDFQSLTENLAMKNVLLLKKRALLAIVHACILGNLRAEMPKMGALGYAGTVKKLLIKNLKQTYTKVCTEHELTWDDLPDIGKFQEMLTSRDFYTFPLIQLEALERAKEFLRRDLPRLIGQAETEDKEEGWNRRIEGGAFNLNESCENISLQDEII